MVNSKSCPSCGRLITNPDAGFCGRCGTRLRPSKWGQVLGSVIGLALAIFLLVGLYNVFRTASAPGTTGGAAAPAPPSLFPPKFDVALHRDILHRNTRGEPPTTLKIVLTDEQPTAVQRVVLNGRAGEKGCDFVRQDKVKACLDSAQSFWGPEAPRDGLHAEFLFGSPEEYHAASDTEYRAASAKQLEKQKAACVESGTSEGSSTPWELLLDVSESPWPQTLKTGYSMTLDGDSCGDQTVSAKIITDRGEATYQFR